MFLPSPSQAKVDCDVFEEERNRVDPLKWAAQLPIVEYTLYFLSLQTEPPFHPTADLFTDEAPDG